MKSILLIILLWAVNLNSQTLVGYWSFTGNAADSSGMGNHGTITGNVTLTTDRCGRPNSAYLFNGGWINTGGNGFPAGNSERTLCAWFKKDPGHLNEHDVNIFGYGSNDFDGCRNYLFISPQSNWLGIECRNTAKIFSWDPTDTNWHYLCAVLNPGSTVTTHYQLYYDGLLVSDIIELNPYMSINTDTQVPTIGCLLGGVLSLYNFYGKIDDVRLYSTALNAQQILQLYNGSCFSCQTTVDAGMDAEIYLGYGSQSTTLNANPTGGTGPYQYLWTPGGATTQLFTVSPTTTTTYSVQVTDVNSCTASDQVVVNVFDTRCGNNGNKVLVCHNGVTICISRNAVATHLGHGDQLDSCVGGPDKFLGDKKLPVSYKLNQNYPNPFNPVTKISFDIPPAPSGKSSFAKLIVYDITGKEVSVLVSEQLNAGSYNVNWSGINLPSGVYFYQLKTDEFIETKKMILIK
jgi:hypothetical protein